MQSTLTCSHSQYVTPGTPRYGEVLAIASGKGGVGKTNLAANLSLCWAAAGKRVLLIDADMSLGNLDVLLNVKSKYTLAHVIDGRKQIEDIIHTGPFGVEMICGASGLENLANLTEFQQRCLVQSMSHLQSQSDILIIDSAAGIAKSVVGFCLAADHVLIVTTPDTTAMADAYGMIKVLSVNGYNGRMSMVVNMANTPLQAKKTYLQIAKVAKQFMGVNLYYAGAVLFDPNLVTAVRCRQPVVTAYPKSPSALAIRVLASRLINMSALRRTDKPFFRKFVKWFC